MKKFKTLSASLLILIAVNAYSQSNITYIPISVGDILIVIPIFDEDSDGNGIPDYEDSGVQPIQMMESFFSTLTVNNIDMAMKFLLTEKSDQYRAAFEDLGPLAGKVVSEVTNTTIVYSDNEIVELAVNRMINGVQRVFFITLMKDENGIWKIVQI